MVIAGEDNVAETYFRKAFMELLVHVVNNCVRTC